MQLVLEATFQMHDCLLELKQVCLQKQVHYVYHLQVCLKAWLKEILADREAPEMTDEE